MQSMKRRVLSMLLAVMMIVTIVPVQVHAEETHSHETSSVAQEIQAAIDAILTNYLGTTSMSQQEIQSVVDAMDWDTVSMAQYEIHELAVSGLLEQLDEHEALELEAANTVFMNFSTAINEKAEDNPYAVSLLAEGSFTLLDGRLSASYSGSSTSDTGTKNSENSCTFQAWASGFGRGSTNTIVFTNKTGNTAILEFSYSISGDCSACSLGITSGSGTYNSGEIPADGEVTITLTGKGGLTGGDEPQLVITGITLSVVADKPNVTFQYDSDKGSITAAGSSVESGTTLQVEKGESIALTASAVSGNTFWGWIDSDNRILSREASYTLTPSSDMTVEAVFASENEPVFLGDSAYLYVGLTEASTSGCANIV